MFFIENYLRAWAHEIIFKLGLSYSVWKGFHDILFNLFIACTFWSLKAIFNLVMGRQIHSTTKINNDTQVNRNLSFEWFLTNTICYVQRIPNRNWSMYMCAYWNAVSSISVNSTRHIYAVKMLYILRTSSALSLTLPT